MLHVAKLVNIFSHFFSVTEPEVAGSCAGVRVKGRDVGHTEVNAAYSYKDKKLSAKVTIAAYTPLRVGSARLAW